mgnify:CR=1 FL=1
MVIKMTPYQIDRATRGGPDVLRGDPKPTAAAHWKRSLKAARIYTNQWCREWVKLYYDRCVTCGRKTELEWAHVLSGKGDAVRWEKLNMTRQCAPCNRLHEYDPEPLMTWFLKTYGQPALFDLTVKSNTVPKYIFSQIMAIGDAYRQEIQEKRRKSQ